MGKYYLVFVKKIIRYVDTFLLITCIQVGGLVFAMDPNPENTYALSRLWKYAQSDEKLPALKDLLNEYPALNINLTNSNKQTVLHIAVLHSATSIVDFLLTLKSDKRIKLNGSDQDYVRKLKIDIDALDDMGRTPLIYAICTGNRTIVEALLKAGAQIKKTNHEDLKILYYITDPRLARYKGVDSYRARQESEKFIKFSDKKLVKLIIESSIRAQLDIDSLVEDYHYTPLVFAVNSKNRAAIEALLEAGAQVGKTDSDGKNVFHHLINATEKSDKKSIQLLIKASKAIDIDVVDNDGNPPLVWAAMQSCPIIVEALLKAGANVHVIGWHDDWHTPLHGVISCVSDDMSAAHEDTSSDMNFKQEKKTIRLLLKAGADMHKLNAAQKTPLRIAFDIVCESFLATDGSVILIELLSWHLYQICTASALPEHISAFRLIKDEYLHSPQSQSLRQANPLLEWIFTQLIECTSKEQISERIFQYLKAAGKEEQRIMLKHMDYLLLKEDILKEFKTLFSLDAFKTLKKFFRYRYAKELKEKIFNSFDEDTLNELIDSTTIENDTQHANVLNKLHDHLISYCNHTQIKSPFIKKIVRISQDNENKKIVDLLTNGYVVSKELTDLEVGNVLKENINATLQLLKDIKAHLDYIIQQDGRSLSSPTRFGTEAGKDIIFD